MPVFKTAGYEWEAIILEPSSCVCDVGIALPLSCQLSAE